MQEDGSRVIINEVGAISTMAVCKCVYGTASDTVRGASAT